MDFIEETKSIIQNELENGNSVLNNDFEDDYNFCLTENEKANFLLRKFNEIKKQEPEIYKTLKSTHKSYKKWYVKNDYNFIDIDNTVDENKKMIRRKFFLNTIVCILVLSAGFYKMFSGRITVGINLRYLHPVIDNGLIYILIGIVYFFFAYYQFRKLY